MVALEDERVASREHLLHVLCRGPEVREHAESRRAVGKGELHGLALDRVGFTVEDRDRSKGLFFVRYVDPEVDLKDTSKLTWADRLAFWKPTPKAAQPLYRISVADSGSSMSQVEVLNSQGAKETSSTGKKILTLLYDQLK